MKLLEEDFTGNDKDIVANFEQKKTIIFRKQESVEDKEMLINYLLKLSKSLANESKWYLIAADIFTIYEKKILNYKDSPSSQFHPMAKQDETQNEISNYKSSFSTEEKELINIFFRACMEAKREKVAKGLLKLSEENGFLIEDGKGFKNKFLKKRKMSKTSILAHIFVLILAVLILKVLSFLNLDEETMDKWMTYLIIIFTVLEVGIFFYIRKK